MTFDHHSLERLKALGRQLPKEIDQTKASQSTNSEKAKKKKLHPIEIENNPEKLFRELMDASPDGNVPIHLLDRLKKIESNSIKSYVNQETNYDNEYAKDSSIESKDLYIQFKQLLLEEDEIN